MTDNRQVVVDLPEHEYLNPIDEKPLSTSTLVGSPEHEYLKAIDQEPLSTSVLVQEKPSSRAGRCGSIVGFVIYIVGSAIPILQLCISRRYGDKCPLDWHIPHYLFIAGVVGIILILLGIIQNVVLFIITKNRDEKARIGGPAAAVLGVGCLVSILFIFLFVWFIFGCYWVFRSWKNVQYVDPKQEDYCHPTLYRFTFWILLIALIFEILSFGESCWKVTFEINKWKNERTTATTTAT